jgi:thiosulfate reductase cytochrome b subunit
VATNGIQGLGWALIVFGIVAIVTGIVIVAGPRIPVLGHLPGDIVIQRENVTIFIPLGTMFVVSIVVSIVLALIARRGP